MEEQTVEILKTEKTAQADAVPDAAAGEEQPADYYRSQQEVDQAFAKRLAQEKKKWEKEASLAAEVERLKTQTAQELPPQEAERPEQPAEEPPAKSEFIQNITREAEEIAEQFPDFRMEKAMENRLFAMMLASGEPLKQVVAYFYPEYGRQEMREQTEREILANIRTRNLRPRSIGHANQGSMRRDVASLSDEEILDIDRRVKRGERVVL